MKELEQVLRDHAARYPLMQPTDAVKLIYQNEFGGGHLIRDVQAVLRYLQTEFARTDPVPELPLWEKIGNGIVRIHLAALPEEKLSWLGEAFLHSAAIHKGSLDSFLSKLDTLRQLTAEGIFSFDSAQLEVYLADYVKLGYPAVSHSQAYRDAYQPAYRIVLEEYLSGEFLP